MCPSRTCARTRTRSERDTPTEQLERASERCGDRGRGGGLALSGAVVGRVMRPIVGLTWDGRYGPRGGGNPRQSLRRRRVCAPFLVHDHKITSRCWLGRAGLPAVHPRHQTGSRSQCTLHCIALLGHSVHPSIPSRAARGRGRGRAGRAAAVAGHAVERQAHPMSFHSCWQVSNSLDVAGSMSKTLLLPSGGAMMPATRRSSLKSHLMLVMLA